MDTRTSAEWAAQRTGSLARVNGWDKNYWVHRRNFEYSWFYELISEREYERRLGLVNDDGGRTAAG